MKPLNIVFLYSEVMGYVESTFNQLLKLHPTCQIYVVHWVKQKNTPHQVTNKDGILYYSRSELTNNKIFDLLVDVDPSILYISGWMDRGYIKAAKRYVRINKEVKVVAGIDDQWHGTFRQRIGVYYFRIFYKNLLNYLWVAGPLQFEYASRFGVDHKNIIYNLYSCRSDLFEFEQLPKNERHRRLIYYGRFHKRKNLPRFIKHYINLPEDIKKSWRFTIIGGGPEAQIIENLASTEPSIELKPFMDSARLREELAEGGVFCYPSKFEAWGVGIHEAVSAGLPLLVSNKCGANSLFLINGYNGFSFDPNCDESINKALEQICSLSNEDLINYSRRSRELSTAIKPEYSAASLLSLLYD